MENKTKINLKKKTKQKKTQKNSNLISKGNFWFNTKSMNKKNIFFAISLTH